MILGIQENSRAASSA
jgi:hypothetical protein